MSISDKAFLLKVKTVSEQKQPDIRSLSVILVLCTCSSSSKTESISLSYVQNKGSFLFPLGLPESLDLCAELVHKLGGEVSILEDLFSPACKSE